MSNFKPSGNSLKWFCPLIHFRSTELFKLVLSKNATMVSFSFELCCIIESRAMTTKRMDRILFRFMLAFEWWCGNHNRSINFHIAQVWTDRDYFTQREYNYKIFYASACSTADYSIPPWPYPDPCLNCWRIFFHENPSLSPSVSIPPTTLLEQ